MKKVWITLLVLAIAGILMTGVGFALGGAGKELYIDMAGIHLNESLKNIETAETDIGEITELEINTASSNIKIIPSDNYGFKLNSYSNNTWFEYTFENGKLEITQKYRFSWNLLNLRFNFKVDTIEIYLPKEALLSNTVIKVTSGTLNADGLDCDNVSVKTTSASLSMRKIISKNIRLSCTSGTVNLSDCSADKFDFDFTSSRLTATGIQSNEMLINGISGSATIDGEIKGSTKINIISGNVNMTILGNKNDYSFVSSVTAGSVFVDGNPANGDFTNASAENTVDVNITSGTARVTFSD